MFLLSYGSQSWLINFQGGNMEPGMAPVLKRGAIVGNKYGLPMYQAPPPPALAYQQMALAAMHLQQQPMYVPITSE